MLGRKRSEEKEGEVFEFPDIVFQGPELDIEAPAADVPYDRYDDHNNVGLLEANGIPATEDAVVAALNSETSVLLAAAAHASGSLSIDAARPRLRELAAGADDQAAVEAAYALVRLGERDAEQVLHEALARPVDGYLSPLLAANYLARLGDPVGYSVVRAGLASDLLSSRMLACKALLLFVPFEGQSGSGQPLDVVGLYDQALRDPDQGIQGEAVIQLRWAPPELARPLLEGYLSTSGDELLRGYAQDALRHLREA